MKHTLVLGVLIVSLQSSTANGDTEKEAWVSKKEMTLQGKRALRPDEKRTWRASLDKQIGKPLGVPTNVYSKWNKEVLVFEPGSTTPPPDEVVNRFLRCHFTNQPTVMDPRLFPVLLEAAKKFRVRQVQIVSAFRDPKYNLTLRKKGRQVARESQHTLGSAVDFRLPGIPIAKLHAWARGLRLGGVGFYQHSGFIHVDVGPVRYWNGT